MLQRKTLVTINLLTHNNTIRQANITILDRNLMIKRIM